MKPKTKRYTIDLVTGCWIWQLHVTRYGYGWARSKGKSQHAHITEFVRANGPVPEGKILDHKCRNRRCVNPSHLEAVSFTENVRRGSCSKLSMADVTQIRLDYSKGSVLQRDLAEKYGVHGATISRIVTGDRWFLEVENPLITRKLLRKNPSPTRRYN